MILNAPALFAAAKGTAWTDLPREASRRWSSCSGGRRRQEVKQLRIVPPRYPTWLTAAWVNQVREDVAALLPGHAGPAATSPSRGRSRPRGRRPRPTPRPTPKPTHAPTAAPTEAPTPEPTQEPPPDPTPAP